MNDLLVGFVSSMMTGVARGQHLNLEICFHFFVCLSTYTPVHIIFLAVVAGPIPQCCHYICHIPVVILRLVN